MLFCITLCDVLTILLVLIEQKCCPEYKESDYFTFWNKVRLIFGWGSKDQKPKGGKEETEEEKKERQNEKGEKEISFRANIAKRILIPRYALGFLACIGEFSLIMKENGSEIVEIPPSGVFVIVLFITMFLYMCCMCYYFCYKKTIGDIKVYDRFLLTYRVLDLLINIALIALECEFEFPDERIITYVILIYSILDLISCISQAFKALIILCVSHRNNRRISHT